MLLFLYLDHALPDDFYENLANKILLHEDEKEKTSFMISCYIIQQFKTVVGDTIGLDGPYPAYLDARLLLTTRHRLGSILSSTYAVGLFTCWF